MASIFITGGNGVLGSTLSDLFLKMGNDVSVVDIVRKDECWRLQELEIVDKINYVWKASQDLTQEDLKDIDLIIDCAIGFPDRPFGTGSPRVTFDANIAPSLGLLQAVRSLPVRPLIIYPSSFNSLYGNQGVYDETTPVNPTTVYGWTKGAVEQLYKAYYYSFGVPVIITRVGSGYGERMRTDELVARLIMASLKEENFKLKSPYSKRLWTYLGDVVDAYNAIAVKSDYGGDHDFVREINERNLVLNIAGNKRDEILNNVQICKLVSEMNGLDFTIEDSETYEAGEIVNGNPVSFEFDAKYTRNLLRWEPRYSLKEGFQRTVEWFNKSFNWPRNLSR